MRADGICHRCGLIIVRFGQQQFAVQIGGEAGLFPLVAATVFRPAHDQIEVRFEDHRVDGGAEVKGGGPLPDLVLPVGQRLGCDHLHVAAADRRVRVIVGVGHAEDHFFLHP